MGISPNTKAPTTSEFLINVRKGKKQETMRFSTEHRADVLTEGLVSIIATGFRTGCPNKMSIKTFLQVILVTVENQGSNYKF